jgi:hypothetical protein
MSTQFSSMKEAKGYLLTCMGLDPNTAEVKDEPELKALGMEGFLLDNPDTDEEIKRSIQVKIDAQKGFSVNGPKGIVKFVIGPFRDGFDCMVFGKNGIGFRL